MQLMYSTEIKIRLQHDAKHEQRQRPRQRERETETETETQTDRQTDRQTAQISGPIRHNNKKDRQSTKGQGKKHRGN